MPAIFSTRATTSNSDLSDSPVPIALIVAASICVFLIIVAVCAFIFTKRRITGKSAERNPYLFPSPMHEKWVSPASSRTTSPALSSNSQFDFSMAVTPTDFTKECPPVAEKTTPASSNESLAVPARPTYSIFPIRPTSTALPPRPTLTALPARPASTATRVSFESYATRPSMSSDSHYDGALSPALTMKSIPTVQDATARSITPIDWSEITQPIENKTIKRTVELRISNHTNHGSPIRFCTPEPQW